MSCFLYIQKPKPPRFAETHGIAIRAELAAGHSNFLRDRGHPQHDAVRILASGAVERAYDGTKMSYFPHEIPRKPFELPAAVKHPARVFAYLSKTRCIDPQIIQKCLHEKILFESEKYHNCVFVGYDGDMPRYASLRGTSTYAEKPFRMDAKGSDKQYPFVMRGRTDLIFTFESAIDAMSHATFF